MITPRIPGRLVPVWVASNAAEWDPDDPPLPPDEGWPAEDSHPVAPPVWRDPGEVEPWQLSDAEVLATVAEARQALATAQACWWEWLAEAERRQAALHVVSMPTSSWLAAGASHSARQARAEVRLAVAVAECPVVADAVATAAVSPEQAAVIVQGLELLPDDLDAAQRERVAAQLVEWAGEFGPVELRRLVHRAVEVVAPEVADAADERALERAERSQRQTRFVGWRRDHDGGLLFSGKLPAVEGRLFTRHLTALAARQRTVDALQGVDVTQAQALADALASCISHHAACGGGAVPAGDATRVVVTLDHAALTAALGSAMLEGAGERVSAGEARRLACAAGILPVVLGGGSLPLDVGRERRLFGAGQRAALALRDGGCAFPGCDRVPADCEAHHILPWWAGGASDVSNGVLLCSHHHRLVEPDPRRSPERSWRIDLDARGYPRFTAPVARDGTRITRQHCRYRI